MLIWICVDNNDAKSSKITKVVDANFWALVKFDEGIVKEVNFYKSREEFNEWVDFIILKDKYESYIDYMNEGMMVLCIREEASIDEIMEAFKFKELDEVGM